MPDWISRSRPSGSLQLQRLLLEAGTISLMLPPGLLSFGSRMLKRSAWKPSRQWEVLLCLFALGVAVRPCRADRNAVHHTGWAVSRGGGLLAFTPVVGLHFQHGGACTTIPRTPRCFVGSPLQPAVAWDLYANPTACRMLPDGYASNFDDTSGDDCSAFLVDPLAAGEPSASWTDVEDKPGTALTPAELDHIPTVDGRDVDPLGKQRRKRLRRNPSPSGWSLAREKRKRQSDTRQLQVRNDPLFPDVVRDGAKIPLLTRLAGRHQDVLGKITDIGADASISEAERIR